jgi:AraC-like DNA-binding protein
MLIVLTSRAPNSIPRRQSFTPNYTITRHRHDTAYVAIVLSGSYEECGNRGRFRVGAGDVLMHDAFDAHLNRFHFAGAQVLNLMVTDWMPSFSIGQIRDPDAIARAAELDPLEAPASLLAQLREGYREFPDWPDILAADILRDPNCRLDSWARTHGLAAETISRGFSRVFGITPASFRAEARAHRAFELIVHGVAPLGSIAISAGFADQAHMCRAVRALTGLAPSWWRRSNAFKTGHACTGVNYKCDGHRTPA